MTRFRELLEGRISSILKSSARVSSERIDYLDGWRACSILLVIVGHFALLPTLYGRDFYTARAGVEAFFVLSGRLMAGILFLRGTSIGTFYGRRFARVFPAYAVLVVLLATFGFLSAFDVVAALTFTANYFYPSEYIEHTWSLCVEEHSYLLLGLLAYTCRDRLPPRLLPALLLLFAAAMMANGAIQTGLMHRDYHEVYWHSDVRAASVLVSAGIYLIAVGRRVSPLIPIAAPVIGLFLLIPYSIPDPVKYTLGTTFLAIGICTLDSAWNWVRATLSVRPLCMVGFWSYSLYLWQQPLYLQQPAINKAALLTATLLAALFSYYVIENPARRYLNLKLAKMTCRPKRLPRFSSFQQQKWWS